MSKQKMSKQKMKRWLAILLTVSMMTGLMPMSALANQMDAGDSIVKTEGTILGEKQTTSTVTENPAAQEATPSDANPVCICTDQCFEEDVNDKCPVCSEDYTDCKLAQDTELTEDATPSDAMSAEAQAFLQKVNSYDQETILGLAETYVAAGLAYGQDTEDEELLSRFIAAEEAFSVYDEISQIEKTMYEPLSEADKEIDAVKQAYSRLVDFTNMINDILKVLYEPEEQSTFRYPSTLTVGTYICAGDTIYNDYSTNGLSVQFYGPSGESLYGPSIKSNASSVILAKWIASGYNNARVESITFNVNGNPCVVCVPGQPSGYSVYFYPNGGSAANKTYSTQITIPSYSAGTRTGYTFENWHLNSVSGAVRTAGQSISSTTYLYANWTPKTYSVVFDNQSGSDTPATATVTYGQKPATVTLPTKTGYDFKGYYTAADGGGTQYYTSAGAGAAAWAIDAAAATTLYASWALHEYGISYALNGGTNATANPSGYTMESDTITLQEPTKAGYTFTGWSGTGITGISKNVTIPKGSQENKSYEANWEKNQYAVIYDANNPSTTQTVSGVMVEQAFTYDEEQSLNQNTFELTGWDFAGWNSQADGKGDTYADQAQVKNLTANPGGEVTLYAIWTAHGYTVVYDSNKPLAASGTIEGATEDSEHIFDTDKNLTENGFTLTGWTFTGWNTTADGGGDAYADKETVKNLKNENSDTITLYAQWMDNPYTVKYFQNKMIGAPTSSHEVTGDMPDDHYSYDDTDEKTLSDNQYKLEGWTFTGWNTQEDGQGYAYGNKAEVKNWTADKDQEIHLYAQWEVHTYDVTYDNNKPANATGTVSGTTDGSSHIYDTYKKLSPSGYTLLGWTFAGWNTKADGTGTHYEDEENVRNLTAEDHGLVTLYAEWKANEYVIRFEANQGQGAVGSTGDILGTMSNATYAYDTGKNLPNNELSLEGWTFTGWNTEPDGDGTSYSDGNRIKNMTVVDGEVFVLYAQWKANHYAVSYEMNQPEQASASVKGNMANSSYVYDLDEDYSLRKNAYTLPGWTFTGWNTKKDGSGDGYQDEAIVKNFSSDNDETVTLYAQWKANEYRIVYNHNRPVGGVFVNEETFMADSSYTYDVAGTLREVNYEFIRYTFRGWNTSADGSGMVYDNLNPVWNLTAEDGAVITLYAQWRWRTSDSGAAGTTTDGHWNEENTNWTYTKADGSQAKSEWQLLSYNGQSKWYHFDAESQMDTGWLRDTTGDWYYLNVNADGQRGAMQTGWITDPQDGHRYYLDPVSGKMAVGHVLIDGIWYDFNTNVPESSGWYYSEERKEWLYDPRSQMPLGALLQ